MADAVCAQTDPEIFFPSSRGQRLDQARAVCGACPVRLQCGEYAQDLEGDLCKTERHGAWGGRSPLERAAAGGPARKADRDEAILRLTARGMRPAEIAEQLDLNVRTVLRVRAANRQEDAA